MSFFWKISLLAVSSLTFVGGAALASRQDIVPGSRYISGQGASMGDAVLPLGDTAAQGLFYNPAVLGRIRKLKSEPMNLQFFVNTPYISALDLNYSAAFTDLGSYKPVLKANPSSYHSAGISLLPNVSWKGISLGVLFSEQAGARYDLATDSITSKSLYYLIPTVGYGLRLADGIVRLGYSFQYVNKAQGNLTRNYALASGYNQGIKEGTGLSHNMGFALTLPFTYLPGINIVARNIGNARYNTSTFYPFASAPISAPDTEPMTIDTALSYMSKLGNGANVNLVGQLRDVTNRSQTSKLLRAAFGFEWTFRSQLFVRFGFGSAYPNAGVGFRSKRGELSLSWTSEEVGAGLRGERDTRYMFHYTIGSFD